MVGFGEVKGYGHYEACFADMPHETRYKDIWSGIDDTAPDGLLVEKLNEYYDMQLEKVAMKTGVTAYASVLIPVYLDPTIVNLTRRDYPFLEMVPRVSNRGKTVDYNRLTARGTADFLAEDASLADQPDAYERDSKAIKFAYSVGRVTGPMISASAEYVDAWALEIQNKTLSLRDLQEKQMLIGNIAGDADIYQIDAQGYLGLNAEITTNTVNASSSTPTISMLRQGVRKCREYHGNPTIMVTDLVTFDVLKSLFQEWLRYPNIANYKLPWGATTIEFEGIPIIWSKSMPTVANKKQILILDMSIIEQRVLQDVVMEELAKTNDSRRFMIKEYSVIVNKAEQFCCKVYGIA